MSGKEQADSDSNTDIAEVEAVFRKAYGLVNAVCDGLHDAVPGVWDDSHI